MSTPKTENAAETKPRKRADRKQDRNEYIFNLLTPIADMDRFRKWVDAVVEGKNPDPSKLPMSQADYEAALQAQKDAKAAGKPIPSVPARYQPMFVEHGSMTNALFAIPGQESKHRKPANWPSQLGEYQKGAYLDDARRCHKTDVRDLVTDREENVLAVGSSEYVVGTSEVPAVFLISGSKTGNYGANIRAGKNVSFDGVAGLGNLVGRINNKVFVERLDDGTKPGAEIIWGPNQCIEDWGHIVDADDKVLTPTQLRKAIAAGETKGFRFKALESPIVGDGFTEATFWQSVKRTMTLAATRDDKDRTALDRFTSRKARSGKKRGEVDERAWDNILVQARTNPDEICPFGFFSAQTKIVPVRFFGDSINEEMIRFVIGVRVGADYAESKHAANRRLNPEKAAAPKAAKASAAPKAAKKAPAKKKAAPKADPVAPAKKKAAPKRKATRKVEAAPPVTDTGESVAAEVEAAVADDVATVDAALGDIPDDDGGD